MSLRVAQPHELAWINARYDEVHFQHSDASHRVVIADIDGAPAGIGRLVPAGEGAYELGGMLVFDAFRGRGIARQIIDELLRIAEGHDVYCIPFADLEPIYARAGFVRIEEDETTPRYVREKMEWCRREMTRPVALMKLTT
ncbi:MAG TPA: GNAT family N-acetyltransferase [Thermoanaerobaculia bacterium]|nr:GNAT family N-acetyltransferase [Thermoanaerobaculia bacterium]